VSKVTETVAQVASTLAEKLGLEVVDVELAKEGGQRVLRVFIDREGGVLHEHCEKMSNALSDELDRLDPIEDSYLLEVSSPGIERPLKKVEDFTRFAGNLITISLFSPLDGQKKITGMLRGLDGQEILLEAEKKKMLRIPYSQVAKAHLAFI
jgi:ribosome maturation factor RimP